MVYACDIGSLYGYISVLREESRDPEPMFPPRYRLEETGMMTTAYVVPPDGVLIDVFSGSAAYDRFRQRNADSLVRSVKTRMTEDSIDIPGIAHKVPVEQIYSAIIRDLIKLGNEQLMAINETPIYELVFTYPAEILKRDNHLSILNKMERSIENVKIDGKNIKVVGRLPEPAAVAIDYLYYLQNIISPPDRIQGDSYTALVYDLGHGTFDIAVVTARSKGEPYEMHISDGLADVGGQNFDDILYNEICRILSSEYNYVPSNENMREMVRYAARDIKHQLTDGDLGSYDIQLRSGDTANIEITRDRFEELSRPLINQTFALVDDVIRQAESRGIRIDALVLSGGASQMPMVLSGLQQIVGSRNIAIRKFRLSKAVSFGAARYAYGRTAERKDEHSSVLEKDSEYCYGIWAPSEDPNNLKGEVNILIEGREKLPAISGKTVSLLSPQGGRMRIKLYRSKEKCQEAKQFSPDDYDSIRYFTVEVPENTECDVRIEVQEDYNVKVVCTPTGGKKIELKTSDPY